MGWRGVSTRAALLARLREGPLRADEWQGLAASAVSLRVRIHYLRDEGFEIETVTRFRGAGRGRQPGAWRLIREPEGSAA